MTEPVGTYEIAERLGVTRKSPEKWQERSRNGSMNPPYPEPCFTVGNSPAWSWRSVYDWAEATGRLKDHTPVPSPEVSPELVELLAAYVESWDLSDLVSLVEGVTGVKLRSLVVNPEPQPVDWPEPAPYDPDEIPPLA